MDNAFSFKGSVVNRALPFFEFTLTVPFNLFLVQLLEKVMTLEKELREVKLDLRIEKRETEKKSGIGNFICVFGVHLI